MFGQTSFLNPSLQIRKCLDNQLNSKPAYFCMCSCIKFLFVVKPSLLKFVQEFYIVTTPVIVRLILNTLLI